MQNKQIKSVKLGSRTFSARQMLLVACTFAVIGVIALIVSFALNPANGDFEAETMTLEAL